MESKTQIGSKDTESTGGAAKTPERGKQTLKARYKLPDGFVLQKEVEVEYEIDKDGAKIIVGPDDVRPPILLGTVIKD